MICMIAYFEIRKTYMRPICYTLIQIPEISKYFETYDQITRSQEESSNLNRDSNLRPPDF